MAELTIIASQSVEVQKMLHVPDGYCDEWNTLVQTDNGDTVGPAAGLEIITENGSENSLIARSAYIFDTTAIPEGAVVTEARVLCYGHGSQSGSPPMPVYADVQARRCTLLAGSGNYAVLANFGLIHDGALVGVMEYGGPGEGMMTWWKSPNLASVFARLAAWQIGFSYVMDNNNPPEGCPPIPYLSSAEEFNVIWYPIGETGIEPKLVVTYTMPDPAAARLALLGVGR